MNKKAKRIITNRVFIHGLESSAMGTKGQYFLARYPGMIVEDFTGPLAQRMNRLNELLGKRDELIMVGSSYGGVMAAIFACQNEQQVRKLILLAPALSLLEFHPYTNYRLSIPTTIYHARQDDVVPSEPVYEIAARIFTHLDYHIVNDNHPLVKTFPLIPWDSLLEKS